MVLVVNYYLMYILSYAGESTASEILLALGDDYNDYLMTIVVRVYDYYGDVNVCNTTVQVRRITKL